MGYTKTDVWELAARLSEWLQAFDDMGYDNDLADELLSYMSVDAAMDALTYIANSWDMPTDENGEE